MRAQHAHVQLQLSTYAYADVAIDVDVDRLTSLNSIHSFKIPQSINCCNVFRTRFELLGLLPPHDHTFT